eukprot:UN26527
MILIYTQVCWTCSKLKVSKIIIRHWYLTDIIIRHRFCTSKQNEGYYPSLHDAPYRTQGNDNHKSAGQPRHIYNVGHDDEGRTRMKAHYVHVDEGRTKFVNKTQSHLMHYRGFGYWSNCKIKLDTEQDVDPEFDKLKFSTAHDVTDPCGKPEYNHNMFPFDRQKWLDDYINKFDLMPPMRKIT